MSNQTRQERDREQLVNRCWDLEGFIARDCFSFEQKYRFLQTLAYCRSRLAEMDEPRSPDPADPWSVEVFDVLSDMDPAECWYADEDGKSVTYFDYGALNFAL